MRNNASSQGNYFVNQELIEEMVRLSRQAAFVTDAMSGALPEIDEHRRTHIEQLVDLGCGPGEWVLRVARDFPHMQVTGVDKSKRMIEYACMQAETDDLHTAQFRIMDITQSLDFPDGSFDLINARFLLSFMKKEQWPDLLAECFRVLRPGGILRITEQESGFTNDPIYQHYIDMWGNAWRTSGHAFAQTSAYIGVTVVMKLLMRQAGFIQPQHRPTSIDLSTGEKSHQEVLWDLTLTLKLAGPFLIQLGVATQSQLDRLYEQMQTLVNKPGFCAYWLLQTTWAQKPGTP